MESVVKYFIKRLSDGAFYCARPGEYISDEEHRWSKDIGKARLYTRESFAKRTITDVPLADDVEIKTFTIIKTPG